MGIHSGKPQSLRRHPVTNRLVYDKAIVDVAVAVSDAGCGGQVLLTSDTLAEVVIIDEDPKWIVIHLGGYMLELPQLCTSASVKLLPELVLSEGSAPISNTGPRFPIGDAPSTSHSSHGENEITLDMPTFAVDPLVSQVVVEQASGANGEGKPEDVSKSKGLITSSSNV